MIFAPMEHFDPNAAALPDSGIFGLNSSLDEAAVHVLPVPFDATASYRKGAWKGPDAILRASRQVDLFDAFTGRPYEQGITMLEPDVRIATLNRNASVLADQVIAAGGAHHGDAELEDAVAQVNEISEEMNARVYEATKKILAAKKLPALVGGDHSTPFGAIRACSEVFSDFGVLHFDAHADLRVAYEAVERGSPLAAPPDRVVYGYQLPSGLRVHTGLGIGHERTAQALAKDLVAFFVRGQEGSR